MSSRFNVFGSQKIKEGPNKQVLAYAPGNYVCKCVTCKDSFFGDKRSVLCYDCAITAQESGNKATHFSFTLRETSTNAIMFFGRYDALVRNIANALWLRRDPSRVYDVSILYEQRSDDCTGIGITIVSNVDTEARINIVTKDRADNAAVIEHDAVCVSGKVTYRRNGMLRADNFELGYEAALAALTEQFKGL